MNRSDPYQARARELALAAGVDPDLRIPMEGKTGRTMPAWCQFRQKARDEQNLAEANALKLGEQAEKYKSSPLKVMGIHDGATLSQMHNCMKVGNVVSAVICADGHMGYAQPVGGVVAYENQISISGVGFDIGCGNQAIRLDTKLNDIRANLPTIAMDIAKTISFGIGRKNEERVEHELFDDEGAWAASDMGDYRQKAQAQLGTVGGGNHYVDLFSDEEDCIWIGVHFGSRGLGHTAAKKYLKLAGGRDGVHVPPAVVDIDSSIGLHYLAAMKLAGRYAYAGREWVVERVRQIVGGAVTKSVHNHHNYAWLEDGLWVVRKGATPAFPGQEGFVGGSMGDDAVIIEGVDGEESKKALYSTIHGAGRLFGRKEAKRQFSRETMDAWLREKGVILHGGDLDESPMAYRRLPEVLLHHEGTIKINHTLKPLVVVMAGAESDPWKD